MCLLAADACTTIYVYWTVNVFLAHMPPPGLRNEGPIFSDKTLALFGKQMEFYNHEDGF